VGSFSLEEFHKIDLDQRKQFSDFYAKFPPNHSDASFVTMVSWAFFMEYYVCWRENFPFVFTLKDGVRTFRIPSGLKDINLIEELLCFASENSSKYAVGLIDEDQKDLLQKSFEDLSFIEKREYFDYVYKSEDLVSLKGKPYAKIRNRMNKFEKKHSYSVEMISRAVIDEVMEYLDEWCVIQDCDEDEVLRFEKLALKFCLVHFESLDLFGVAIRVDGKIKAFSLCERISKKKTIVHFEKGDPKLDGIYKVVNFETARYIHENGGEWINRESDMGVLGLRKAKLGYRPNHFVHVYLLDKQSIVNQFGL